MTHIGLISIMVKYYMTRASIPRKTELCPKHAKTVNAAGQ